MDKKVGGFGV